MKINIPLNSLIRHIGEDRFKEILESVETSMPSLKYLAQMRQYDIVLELTTDEFDALMSFKMNEQ